MSSIPMHSYLLLLVAARVGARSQPNIVFVLTDDQDIELGGLTPMNNTRRLLGEEGAVGEAFYVNTPICCPSRTEYLSGRMYHNVLTPDLSGCMHVNSTGYIFQSTSALVPMLQAAGYRTGGFGKIINGQGRLWSNSKKKHFEPITNGWDWLSAPLDEGDYFANDFFNKVDNGTHWIETLGPKSDVVAEWYQTAQIGNRSLKFIRDSVAMQKPFFAYLGPHAPHYSADAPPWAQTIFSEDKAPRTPAYNTSIGQKDKALHVAQNPPISADMELWIDRHFRDRWRSIVGVDDMIALVYAELEKLQVLDNTFIFFTSDHGYKLGEWRIGCSKQHPYETDVHIPLMVRGPGIAPGTRLKSLAANIDITPTLIDIAGLPPTRDHDGKSFLPMLRSSEGSEERLSLEADWRSSLLIEYLSVGTYYNDHAKIWVSGPGDKPGTPPKYGQGPFSPEAKFKESDCAASEGSGSCYFVDSKASNNWIALRVRNVTHNFVYAESYGAKAMASTTPDGKGKGIFKCLPGDNCQRELYHYGKITSDYPHFPVMDESRWNLHNEYSTTESSVQDTLHAELKNAYCSTRRLAQDRMECESATSSVITV